MGYLRSRENPDWGDIIIHFISIETVRWNFPSPSTGLISGLLDGGINGSSCSSIKSMGQASQWRRNIPKCVPIFKPISALAGWSIIWNVLETVQPRQDIFNVTWAIGTIMVFPPYKIKRILVGLSKDSEYLGFLKSSREITLSGVPESIFIERFARPQRTVSD